MKKLRYLVDLFESIEVTEKGIEKVYDYLLKNQVIEDPKSILNELDLSLKRVYKILKVLKDCNLVQTYDRPMKAVLNPPIKVWQKLISNQIKKIQQEANSRIEFCEKSYDLMIKAYRIKPEEPPLSPVEYINISQNEDPLEFLTKDLVGNVLREIMFARDLNFDIPFLQKLIEVIDKPDEDTISKILDFSVKLEQEFADIKFNILFSEEYLEELILENESLLDKFKNLNLQPTFKEPEKIKNNFSIKIHPTAVGNFTIKDNKELLQYSIHPSNYIMGIFVSRQNEIIEIFRNKFTEKFQDGIPLTRYFELKKREPPSILTKILFTLL